MVATADKIHAAARKLLDKEGVEAVTMRAVAKVVGITPMAIYRHYPDREALLNALADEGFADLTARLRAKRLTGSIEDRLAQLADVYTEHALENPKLFELMFLTRRQGARRFPRDFKAGRSPTATPAAEVLAEGMKSGVLRDDDLWEINFEMGALYQGLIMLYLGGRMDMTPSGFRAFYRRSIRRYIHGIVA
ncbi:MAG TPA: TetR/AcrR family transcriptional regulator [Gammaproteobacteria bacterium]|jgi:AcrR family transcriptional regulator